VAVVQAADAEAPGQVAVDRADTGRSNTERATEKLERKMGLTVMLLSTVLMFAVVAFVPDEPPGQMILQRPFLHQSGHAYVGHLSFVGPKPDEKATGNRSTLQLFEDDKPLGPQHISSDDIAREGHGMYLFWGEKGETALVFSASDNSDPNANGRAYRVFDPLVKGPKDPYEKALRIPVTRTAPDPSIDN